MTRQRLCLSNSEWPGPDRELWTHASQPGSSVHAELGDVVVVVPHRFSDLHPRVEAQGRVDGLVAQQAADD